MYFFRFISQAVAAFFDFVGTIGVPTVRLLWRAGQRTQPSVSEEVTSLVPSVSPMSSVSPMPDCSGGRGNAPQPSVSECPKEIRSVPGVVRTSHTGELSNLPHTSSTASASPGTCGFTCAGTQGTLGRQSRACGSSPGPLRLPASLSCGTKLHSSGSGGLGRSPGHMGGLGMAPSLVALAMVATPQSAAIKRTFPLEIMPLPRSPWSSATASTMVCAQTTISVRARLPS